LVPRQLRGNLAGVLRSFGNFGKIQSLIINPFLHRSCGWKMNRGIGKAFAWPDAQAAEYNVTPACRLFEKDHYAVPPGYDPDQNDAETLPNDVAWLDAG